MPASARWGARPGLSSYRSSPVALGTIALYAFLLTAISARYTRLLPAGMWLSIHRLALVVWGLSWLHGILAGTDSDPLRPMYVVCGLAVVGGGRVSLLGVPPSRPTFTTSRPEGSPMNVPNTSLRRTLTVVGVAAALLVGFGAIRRLGGVDGHGGAADGRAGFGRDACRPA